MASIPLAVIENLYYKCLAKRNNWYSGGRAYEMIVSDSGIIHLRHYGTTIFYYDPKTRKSTYGGAYSISDRDAINSIVFLSQKGKGVYYRNGKLWQDGTGPEYEPKKTAKKTRRV